MKPRLVRCLGIAKSLSVLMALSGCGGGSSDPTPLPETLSVAAPAAGDVASAVEFGNSAGTLDGIKYAWDFGDGTISEAAKPSHRYANAGEYQVTLKITNQVGESKQVSHVLMVNNQAAVRGLDCSGVDSGGWCRQVPTSSIVDVRDVTFVDSRTGWRVGALGLIQRTTDGGKTWARQRSDVTSDLNQVVFFDARVGWARSSQGMLLRTTDAGETWAAVASPATVPAAASIQALPSAQSILIAEGSGRYYWSEDAGGTWRSADMQFSLRQANGGYLYLGYESFNDRLIRYTTFGATPATILDFRGSTRIIRAVTATQGNVIVALTQEADRLKPADQKFWRSEDGGGSWTSWTPEGPLARWSEGILALDPAGSVLIVNADQGLFRSEDGGHNWTLAYAHPAGSGVNSGKLQVAGPRLLFVPMGSFGFDGPPLISNDQGRTWLPLTLPPLPSRDLFRNAQTLNAAGGVLILWDGNEGKFFSTDFGASWTQTVQGPMPAPSARRTAVFRDARYGVMFNGLGETQVTTDGGRNWTARSIGAAPSGLQFIDATRAVMAAQDGRFYRSVDGGEHWSLTASTQRIGAFRFFGARNGWAVDFYGSQQVFGSPFLLTRDGGDSWVSVTTAGGWVTEGGSTYYAGIFDAHIADSGRITVVGSGPGGYIAQSDDNGVTWIRRSTGLPLNDALLYRIYSRDGQVFWVLSNGSNLVLRSVDGGVSWTKVEVPAGWRPNRVQFVDAKNGWMVGEEGLIVATRDGGATWAEQASGTRARLNDLQFVDARTGWIGISGTDVLATGTGGF